MAFVRDTGSLCDRLFREARPALVLLLGMLCTTQALAARCLYVSSYHPEYVWNKGIEKGLEAQLSGKCEIKKFYMDTQRHPEANYAEERALEAKKVIEQFRPDVVIACDDAASKYLIMPYYKNAGLPVVFCGINWSVEPYGYPYSNATGMVEVSPVKPLLRQAIAIRGSIKTAVFLAADVLTQKKEFDYLSKAFAKEGVALSAVFVRTLAEWRDAYAEAQKADLVYISNAAGIPDWDNGQAATFVYHHSRQLTVTTYEQMMSCAMLGMTKVAEEQGEWSGKVALRMLAGGNPKDIPIVANRRWNLYINNRLLHKVKIVLPDQLIRKAVKVAP